MSGELKQPEQRAKKKNTEKTAEPEERFLTTVSPHIHGPDDIPRVMWTVVAALLPALFAGCYFFGFSAVRTILIAVGSAVVFEAVIQKATRKKVTVTDGSAVVTGLLVAFVMPSDAPWFVPLVASVFAIGIVKQAFGGLGCNIWNPALAGRAFVVACFAGLTVGGWGTNWVEVTPAQRFGEGYTRADAVTGASALSARKDYGEALRGNVSRSEYSECLGRTPRETLRKIQQRNNTLLLDMFLGAQVGCVGETSALALIVGSIILLATKTIRWYIPLAFIGTVAVLGWALPVRAGAFDAGEFSVGWVWFGGQPLFEVLAGGVMLGAIFMATDMVTSPVSRNGKLIFGFGCGLITVLIRKYGGYPEGVCYSILLMNTAVPLIDDFTKPRVYGTRKR